MSDAFPTEVNSTEFQRGGAAAVFSRPMPMCTDCLGSGGWYRYEPALEPAPGLLYLSCVRCRGSGHAAPPQAA